MRDSRFARTTSARSPAKPTPPSVGATCCRAKRRQLFCEQRFEAARARREKQLHVVSPEGPPRGTDCAPSGAASEASVGAHQNGFITTRNTTPIRIGSAGISLIQR